MMTNFIGVLAITAFVATGHRCANGHWPVAGVSCAAARDIVLGTWLQIEGIGLRRVDDRYNIRLGPRVDLFFETSAAEARVWGNRKRRVSMVSK